MHTALLKLFSCHRRLVYAALSDTGLSVGQPKVLDYLIRQDGCVQKQLAEACEIEPATLSSLLGKMEKDGLVLRRSREGDRRFLTVHLTPKGYQVAKKVETVFAQLEETAYEGFSLEERHACQKWMQEIYKNLKSEWEQKEELH